ncbi:hypothetical protein [Aureliella helgolandensis]|uniref:Uncharacterized protein n=1 Tax=Aureliella helgolandensis TaxID=2527968 RepID=A0A518G0K2_9BACT|nr:hypothetical protein [Aureliella helgolandensis]QDV22132.1 hypothetical protein Q31a_04150 [Aureliella helgolandensis]
MLLFAKRYMTALAGLLLALGAYHLLLLPVIEPPGRDPAPLPEYISSDVADQWWRELFAQQDWQLDTPRILQNKNNQGVMLSQEYQQVGLKSLKLRPLTIIIPQVDKSGSEVALDDGQPTLPEEVWLVNAEEGAVIHFKEALDLRNGRLPSVERGELSGNITITRVNLHPDAQAVPWSLQTRDLFIERGRVFTNDRVTIRWADSIIRGRDLRIEMKGDLFNPGGNQTNSPWGPLDKMDLYTLEQIDVGLPTGGLWSSMKLPLAAPFAHLASAPARLQVNSQGRFSFDFRDSTASLTNGVQIVHLLGDKLRDTFNCQQLNVAINPPSKDSPPPSQTASTRLGDFEILTLEATGIDQLEEFVGEKKVELKAPSIDAFASAKRLDIDFLQKRIEFDGKLNIPTATQSIAWLKYAGYEFRSPRIDYEADSSPASQTSRHLGYLIAEGPGELTVPADSATGATEIRWQDTLKMSPSETPGEQWVGIFGSTLIESRLHGFMASDKIEIWLKKNPTATSANLASTAAATPGSTTFSTSKYAPEHIRATGHIAIETPQIKAKVDRLDVTLVLVAPSPSMNGDSTASEGLALSDSAGNPMYQWIQPPPPNSGNPLGRQVSTANQTGPNAASGNQLANRDPVTIHGQTLTSRIVLSGKQSWIDDLEIAGPLQVWKEPLPNSKLPGWHVEGDTLNLTSDAAGQVNLNINGQPARVVFADGALQGPTIRIDQKNNLVWMDQPGEFTVPTQLARVGNPGATASTGPAIEWLKAPHCVWQGGMYFDGNVVRIKGSVQLDATLRSKPNEIWLLNGNADEMHIHLTAPIALQSSNSSRSPEATIERIVLQDKVQGVDIFAKQVDQLGTPKINEHLNVPALTFHAIRNEVIGSGPGSIQSWHRGKSGLAQMASTNSSTATTSTTAESAWQGAHLVFRDHLVAFLDHSEVVFEGKVEFAAGPVASLEQRIDLHEMQGLSIGQMLMGCDQLRVYDTSGLSSTNGFLQSGADRGTWEFQASGNVDVQGRAESGNYFGNASEISYSQVKEQLLFKGAPQRDAKIVKVPESNSPTGTITAFVQLAAINPRTLDVEEFKIGAGGVGMESASPGFTAAGQTTPLVNPSTLSPSVNGRINSPSTTQPRSAVSGFLQGKQ